MELPETVNSTHLSPATGGIVGDLDISDESARSMIVYFYAYDASDKHIGEFSVANNKGNLATLQYVDRDVTISGTSTFLSDEGMVGTWIYNNCTFNPLCN